MPATSPDRALGKFIIRKLPSGTDLNIPRLGIENKLVDFIEDPSRPGTKTTWFDFDRITFATGTANLQPSSTEQLENIASVLKAYPAVTVKIGGYTDSSGSLEADARLSRHRAANIVQELLSRGINPSRIQDADCGGEYPVAGNETEEDRRGNPRISLLVTAK